MLKTLATAGALFTAALIAPASPAQADFYISPPPGEMVIDIAAANGSGCPIKDTTIVPSQDNKAITVIYGNGTYTASVGPEAGALDFRKNCQLMVNVHVPQGYTFAVASADYRGYGKLAPGASGYQQANYYFQGEMQTTRQRHDFNGPMDNDWQVSDSVGIGSLSFLPCGERRFLAINTELRVSAGRSDVRKDTSFLGMDSTDASIKTIYHLAWKKC